MFATCEYPVICDIPIVPIVSDILHIPLLLKSHIICLAKPPVLLESYSPCSTYIIHCGIRIATLHSYIPVVAEIPAQAVIKWGRG